MIWLSSVVTPPQAKCITAYSYKVVVLTKKERCAKNEQAFTIFSDKKVFFTSGLLLPKSGKQTLADSHRSFIEDRRAIDKLDSN